MISASVIRCAGLVIAGLSIVALPSEASAYTPEQEQACSGDAMRLCGEFVPDVDRITACMVQKKAQLTQVCRAQFGPPPELRRVGDVRTRPVRVKPRKPHKHSAQ